MLWILLPEKSDGFGRVRTHDLGYQFGSSNRDLKIVPLREVDKAAVAFLINNK
jgi:hypothetical protein